MRADKPTNIPELVKHYFREWESCAESEAMFSSNRVTGNWMADNLSDGLESYLGIKWTDKTAHDKAWKEIKAEVKKVRPEIVRYL